MVYTDSNFDIEVAKAMYDKLQAQAEAGTLYMTFGVGSSSWDTLDPDSPPKDSDHSEFKRVKVAKSNIYYVASPSDSEPSSQPTKYIQVLGIITAEDSALVIREETLRIDASSTPSSGAVLLACRHGAVNLALSNEYLKYLTFSI
jgi:hypothetical protein